jgi:hypothetical protein
MPPSGRMRPAATSRRELSRNRRPREKGAWGVCGMAVPRPLHFALMRKLRGSKRIAMCVCDLIRQDAGEHVCLPMWMGCNRCAESSQEGYPPCLPLRDAMNFVARSFKSQDTLRSCSAAMRVNSAAVSSVVRIMTCASFVGFSAAGLPAFAFVLVATGSPPRLLSTVCSQPSTEHCCSLLCVGFP